MTFEALYNSVADYVRLTGSDVITTIKGFINESIDEFLDQRDWFQLIEIQSITTDDSDSYSLDADFHHHLTLWQNDTKYEFVEYRDYARLTDKTLKFSVIRGEIYIEGTGADFILSYITQGTPYPLSSDSDESEVIEYYPYIIKQWTIWKMGEWLQDQPTIDRESRRLSAIVERKTKSENRMRKNGRDFRIESYRRT